MDFDNAGWFFRQNFTIWACPGEANLSVLRMHPNAPGHCVEHQDWFVIAGVVTDQLRDAIQHQKDALQPEDIGLCESVKNGLTSSG